MRDQYFGSHEFQHREEASRTSSNRSFGLVFAGFFALLSVLGFWRGTGRWPIWLGLCFLSLALALLAPRALAPLNWVWTKIGLLLHHIVSPVFLDAPVLRLHCAGWIFDAVMRPGSAAIEI